MAPSTIQHRRTHNILLISKLLNQRDASSPFTLILDNLEQSGQPLLAEYTQRANVRPISNSNLTARKQQQLTHPKPGSQSKSHLHLLRDSATPPKRRRLHPSLEPKPAVLAARSGNSHQTRSESKCVLIPKKNPIHPPTQPTNTAHQETSSSSTPSTP
jgi:hypothetical protein